MRERRLARPATSRGVAPACRAGAASSGGAAILHASTGDPDGPVMASIVVGREPTRRARRRLSPASRGATGQRTAPGHAPLSLSRPSSPPPSSTTPRPRSPACARSTTAASITCATRCRRSSTARRLGGGCAPAIRSCASTPTPSRAPTRASATASSPGPGTYETTLTRPDLFGDYYLEQFRLLLREPRRRRSRSAPARSRSRCTSRSPSTTTSRAA